MELYRQLVCVKSPKIVSNVLHKI